MRCVDCRVKWTIEHFSFLLSIYEDMKGYGRGDTCICTFYYRI